MNIRLQQVLPADIERRSMEIIESELPHPIDPALAPIIKRVVHTSADFDYVDNLCFSENVVEKALQAIRNRARSTPASRQKPPGTGPMSFWSATKTICNQKS